MERYKCRFCFKSFINGSALGGHMRSHMLTLSSKRELYQEEERPPSQLSEETESDASSSFDEEEEEEEDHHLKSTRVDDKEMEFGFSESSETESSRINPTRRRSKRTRKLGSFDFDFKKLKTVQAGETEHHHSSASDTTTEEDLAFCLIMLSRDKWKKKQTVVEEADDDDDESDHECKNRGGRGRFKCETCGKVFKSYQALGGHRASHKKNKTFTKTEHEKTEYSVIGGGVGEKKIHQCPICFRVFSSGQALGGHKRSHGINNIVSGRVLSVNGIVRIPKEVKDHRMIDLNLPAPNEEDHEPSVVFDEW